MGTRLNDLGSPSATTSLRSEGTTPRTSEYSPSDNLRLSAHKTAREFMPFTESWLEYELMMRHPYSYTAQTSDFAGIQSLRALEVQTLFGGAGSDSRYALTESIQLAAPSRPILVTKC